MSALVYMSPVSMSRTVNVRTSLPMISDAPHGQNRKL